MKINLSIKVIETMGLYIDDPEKIYDVVVEMIKPEILKFIIDATTKKSPPEEKPTLCTCGHTSIKDFILCEKCCYEKNKRTCYKCCIREDCITYASKLRPK